MWPVQFESVMWRITQYLSIAVSWLTCILVRKYKQLLFADIQKCRSSETSGSRQHEDPIKVSLKLLNTIVLWWFEVFKGVTQLDRHNAEKRYLSDIYTSDYWYIFSPTSEVNKLTCPKKKIILKKKVGIMYVWADSPGKQKQSQQHLSQFQRCNKRYIFVSYIRHYNCNRSNRKY